MKKFLGLLVMLMMIMIFVGICSANTCANNSHYIFVTTSQGAIYLDLRTVNVQDYNPPYYQIAGDFVRVNGDDEHKFEVVVRYNWETKETYHLNKGYWTKDVVKGETTNSRNNRKVADALFIAAYGMDFYGY